MWKSAQLGPGGPLSVETKFISYFAEIPSLSTTLAKRASIHLRQTGQNKWRLVRTGEYHRTKWKTRQVLSEFEQNCAVIRTNPVHRNLTEILDVVRQRRWIRLESHTWEMSSADQGVHAGTLRHNRQDEVSCLLTPMLLRNSWSNNCWMVSAITIMSLSHREKSPPKGPDFQNPPRNLLKWLSESLFRK